ncbi:MAG: hypothetical protein MRERV_21c023 [Mycoplasmataceae bacterium RV_VA103A]|nr:MAG: hypothetical protein MRERV_21c023 [Mycoplasmataceae bacterium RV_VA103A]
MRSRVKWRKRTDRDFGKIGNERIEKKIRDKVEGHLADNPFWHGYSLWGKWEGFWGYHIDDYRAIYEIVYEVKGEEILVAKVGQRKPGEIDDVYGGYHPRPTTTRPTITQRPQARDFSRKVARDNGKRKVGHNGK